MNQTTLVPHAPDAKGAIEFDFPSIHVGVSEYTEGPTGATVIWFPGGGLGTIDVRGGAPGVLNSDWLRQGHETKNLDAIAIAGGSWYGLAATSGVAGALKETGKKSGHWADLANVAGAIIYDFGDRRSNEIHPDEKLGASALQAAVPGRFPAGARGAGRMAMQASYFGLRLQSGQGCAFRDYDGLKVACFAVVNCVGAVVDREGYIACGEQDVPIQERHIKNLLDLVPDKLRTVPGDIVGHRINNANEKNTTISVIVTNQTLSYHDLRRLSIQVHASMGRAIQPFSTANDGDVLFAVSTQEIEAQLHPTDLGVVASEVMWDALLASPPRTLQV